MTWQLRRALPTDLDAIMLLESSTFGADAWSRHTMLAELENDACWYVVAFPPHAPDTIEGYAGVQAAKGSATADIQTIAVDASSRRGGLGRVLMNTLINEAQKRGAEEVFLEVRADNPAAQRLYVSLGFEQIGVRAKYYQPDGVDALVMKLAVPQRLPGFASARESADSQGETGWSA